MGGCVQLNNVYDRYLTQSFLGCSSVVHFSVISWQKSTVTVWLDISEDNPDCVNMLASRVSGFRRAPFLTAGSRSLSKGPGDPWKEGSGVAEPEQTVRSMLVVGGLVAALGWWVALRPAEEVVLAGRTMGQ